MFQVRSGTSTQLSIICVCFQELKSVLPVAAPVWVAALVLSGYYITEIVVLLTVIIVLGHSH